MTVKIFKQQSDRDSIKKELSFCLIESKMHIQNTIN